MQTEAKRLGTLAAAVSKAAPDFDEEEQRVALEVYRRVAKGSPAPAEDVAVRAATSPEHVEDLLRSWPGVFLDRDGSVVGFWGLTIERPPPTHRLEVDASPESGEPWTAEHPGTFLPSLDEAFELGRLVNALSFPSELGAGR